MRKMTVTGNLGFDAKANTVNGQTAINFSLANNKKWKDDDGTKHTDTLWVNCTLWRKKPGTLLDYLKKGTLILVEGEPSVSTYRDKDGVTRVDFKLRVNDLELLSSGDTSSDAGSDQPKQEQTAAAVSSGNAMESNRPGMDDDLPF